MNFSIKNKIRRKAVSGLKIRAFLNKVTGSGPSSHHIFVTKMASIVIAHMTDIVLTCNFDLTTLGKS
jgi:hypothetical protein